MNSCISSWCGARAAEGAMAEASRVNLSVRGASLVPLCSLSPLPPPFSHKYIVYNYVELIVMREAAIAFPETSSDVTFRSPLLVGFCPPSSFTAPSLPFPSPLHLNNIKYNIYFILGEPEGKATEDPHQGLEATRRPTLLLLFFHISSLSFPSFSCHIY